jgi:deoxyribonuclease V
VTGWLGSTALVAGWPRSVAAARAVQERLRAEVVAAPLTAPVRRVAGIDVSYRHGRARAAVALVDATSLELVASVILEEPAAFPYVPGYLSFREAPPALRALACLAAPPDLLIVDGQGRAHPRRFGLACHLGVLTSLPTIGVAKSRLVGTHQEPAPARGAREPLLDRDEAIGTVLRTRARVRPLYVSIGHRVTLADAERWTLALCGRWRVPEPTRLADLLSKGGRRSCAAANRRPGV